MNITEAFNKAKTTGRHVRRSVWNKGTHVQLKSYSIRTGPGRGKSYTATLEDLLSSDWEFYTDHLIEVGELEHGQTFTVPDIRHPLSDSAILTKVECMSYEHNSAINYCIDMALRLYKIEGTTLIQKV